MFDDACILLESAGYIFQGLSSKSRKLTFDSADGTLRVLMIRGADVLSYVEHGGADMGVVGLDLILEQGRHVLEPLDLKFGLCRLVVAAPSGLPSVPVSRPVRVATKYPRLAEQFFLERGMSVEILKLYGSLELAPKVGMADQIVDLVATGKTLRENQMEIREEILVSTARLVVNRASWSLKNDRIRLFMDRILPFLSKERVISEG
ncbi:MAG: ATP phosphoribosyltransferase [Nitrospirae bacterium]|jgi:ATP phosphoribosyltransferase|nr:ATP phosphoribosyltransferase [Nitrospirota bacterium]